MKNSTYNDPIKSETPNPYEGYWRFINLNNEEIFIAEKGEGENMILINGIAASSFTWRKVFYQLAEVFHVTVIDFKGTGFSDKPKGKYSINIYTEQILKLMRFLNMEKAILVGNSLGGEIALDFSIKHSEYVSAIVLIDSAGYQKNKKVTSAMIKTGRFKITNRILKLLTTRALAKGIIKWAIHNNNIINSQMVEGYYSPMKERGGIEAFVSLVKSLSYSDFDFSKVYDIDKPTLIMWGKEDKWIPVSDGFKFHKAIKNSKIKILESCGHAPQEEKPKEVIEIIKDFFNV